MTDSTESTLLKFIPETFNKTMFIRLTGLGTSLINKDNLQYYTVCENGMGYYLCDYDSKWIGIHDFFVLLADISSLKKGVKSRFRLDRQKFICEKILYFASLNENNRPKFEKIMLIGYSHGSVIFHSCLILLKVICLERNIDITDLFKRIQLITNGSPYHPPGTLLKPYETDNVWNLCNFYHKFDKTLELVRPMFIPLGLYRNPIPIPIPTTDREYQQPLFQFDSDKRTVVITHDNIQLLEQNSQDQTNFHTYYANIYPFFLKLWSDDSVYALKEIFYNPNQANALHKYRFKTYFKFLQNFCYRNESKEINTNQNQLGGHEDIQSKFISNEYLIYILFQKLDQDHLQDADINFIITSIQSLKTQKYDLSDLSLLEEKLISKLTKLMSVESFVDKSKVYQIELDQSDENQSDENQSEVDQSKKYQIDVDKSKKKEESITELENIMDRYRVIFSSILSHIDKNEHFDISNIIDQLSDSDIYITNDNLKSNIFFVYLYEFISELDYRKIEWKPLLNHIHKSLTDDDKKVFYQVFPKSYFVFEEQPQKPLVQVTPFGDYNDYMISLTYLKKHAPKTVEMVTLLDTLKPQINLSDWKNLGGHRPPKSVQDLKNKLLEIFEKEPKEQIKIHSFYILCFFLNEYFDENELCDMLQSSTILIDSYSDVIMKNRSIVLESTLLESLRFLPQAQTQFGGEGEGVGEGVEQTQNPLVDLNDLYVDDIDFLYNIKYYTKEFPYLRPSSKKKKLTDAFQKPQAQNEDTSEDTLELKFKHITSFFSETIASVIRYSFVNDINKDIFVKHFNLLYSCLGFDDTIKEIEVTGKEKIYNNIKLSVFDQWYLIDSGFSHLFDPQKKEKPLKFRQFQRGTCWACCALHFLDILNSEYKIVFYGKYYTEFLESLDVNKFAYKVMTSDLSFQETKSLFKKLFDFISIKLNNRSNKVKPEKTQINIDGFYTKKALQYCGISFTEEETAKKRLKLYMENITKTHPSLDYKILNCLNIEKLPAKSIHIVHLIYVYSYNFEHHAVLLHKEENGGIKIYDSNYGYYFTSLDDYLIKLSSIDPTVKFFVIPKYSFVITEINEINEINQIQVYLSEYEFFDKNMKSLLKVEDPPLSHVGGTGKKKTIYTKSIYTKSREYVVIQGRLRVVYVGKRGAKYIKKRNNGRDEYISLAKLEKTSKTSKSSKSSKTKRRHKES